MSPSARRTRMLRACFPRVSGDEPRAMQQDLQQSGFSPRERG